MAKQQRAGAKGKAVSTKKAARKTSKSAGTKTGAKAASSRTTAAAKKTRTTKAASKKATTKKAVSKKAVAKKSTAAEAGTTQASSAPPAPVREAAALPAAHAPPPPQPLTTLMDVPDPDAPLSELETDQLWSLYRIEVQRLRDETMAAKAAEAAEEAADDEENLDEADEFIREAAADATLAASRKMVDEGGHVDDEPKPAPRQPSLKDLPMTPHLEALRNELIERHYPLVRYIAERLLQTLPKSIELDDLVSAGQFGLMDAIRGFDPTRGIKFKTYCSTRVRGSILDQLRSQDWVPRLVRLRASRIEKAYQKLTGQFGREPTHSELARELEMDHTQLSIEMESAQARTMFSLSEKWDDDDDGSVEKVEIIEDHDAIDPVTELNRRDLMKYITRSLTHKERFIIEQYYQFGHTMREIGEMLMLTESRVCQIHSNVMGRLKSLLAQRTDSLNG